MLLGVSMCVGETGLLAELAFLSEVCGGLIEYMGVGMGWLAICLYCSCILWSISVAILFAISLVCDSMVAVSRQRATALIPLIIFCASCLPLVM